MKRPHRRRTVALAAVVAVGLGAGLALAGLGLAGHKRTRSVAPPTPTQLTELRRVALETATQNGDPNPTGLQVLWTTKKTIFGLNNGPEPADDPDVFVVTLHGQFVATNARVPIGSSPPTGDEMILIFDAQTLEPSGFMLGDTPLDLSQIGPPQPLSVP